MGIRVLRKGKNGAPSAAPTGPDSPAPSESPDAVAADEHAKEEPTAPNPLSTPAADAPIAEQPSAPGLAPVSITPVSFLPANPNIDWTDPKRDTTKVDSLGNEKTDKYQAGPKGESLPADVQTDAQRQIAADARDAKLAEHMAPTVLVDSIGKPKGTFEVTSGGLDKNGAKKPDIVDYSKPVEPPQIVVGPRGRGAPKDTFHGPRPAAKP